MFEGRGQIEAAFAAANWKEPSEDQIAFADGVGRLLEQQLKLLPLTMTKEEGRREWARIVAGAYAAQEDTDA